MRRRTETGRLARAVWATVQEDFLGTLLVIRDTGHGCGEPTITNDAEGVVAELVATRKLKPRTRLLYIDSEGDLTQILHDGRKFLGFAHPERCPTDGCFGPGPDVADQGPDPDRGIPIPCPNCGVR